MARTEYYDDPDAPVPHSLVVAASAAVFDDGGRLLLQRRVDNGLWAMPGGTMEMTESLPELADSERPPVGQRMRRRTYLRGHRMGECAPTGGPGASARHRLAGSDCFGILLEVAG